MLRFDHRSILSVRFSARLCAEKIMLLSEFMNIGIIPILSEILLFCCILALRFVFSVTASRFVESHFVGFQMHHQHELLQVFGAVSAAAVLGLLFCVSFLFSWFYLPVDGVMKGIDDLSLVACGVLYCNISDLYTILPVYGSPLLNEAMMILIVWMMIVLR